MEIIQLPPDAYSLMSANRHIGYSLPAAVADIVDNSVSARAKNVNIIFGPQSEPYVAIMDDGIGMSWHELRNAMTYGSADPNAKRDENDLGRYGLGMKTASLSQGRRLTVVSAKDGKISIARWDLDFIKNERKSSWPLQRLGEAEIKELPVFELFKKQLKGRVKTGTLVVWQEIDFGGSIEQISYDREMSKIRDHISLVFHRFLSGEDVSCKVRIKVNKDELKPINPFLLLDEIDEVVDAPKKKGQQAFPTTSIGEGEGILFRAYTLPYDRDISESDKNKISGGRGLRLSQGFYIYRGKRLITYGSWFGLRVAGEFSKLARIMVDLPNTMDLKWQLDVKKSKAVPPQSMLDDMRVFVDRVIDRSVRLIGVHVRGTQTKNENKIPQVWDNTFSSGVIKSVMINRKHPIIEKVLRKYSQLDRILALIEKTLPVDLIYYSRSSDSRLENEEPIGLDSMISLLKEYIEAPTRSERRELFHIFVNSDPFVVAREQLVSREDEIVA